MRVSLFIAAAAALSAQSLEKDVQPIFRELCYGCHAATVKMGSLDVQTHEGLMRGGNQGTIIVPGKAEESRLYLILSGKLQPAMPMGGRKLAAGELEIVKKWIDAGAKPDPSGSSKPSVQQARPNIKPRGTVKPALFSLAWNGGVLAAGGYQTARLLDGSGKQAAALDGEAEAVRAIAVSNDGKRIAAAGGLPGRQGEVKIWDTASRQLVATIDGHSDCIYAVAFSPDGQTVATASYDKMIYLWDAKTGRQIRPLKDHIDAIYALAFTPDGSRLISAAADRTIKIWDPSTGERRYTLSEPTDGVNAIAISPDGKMAAAAGIDKTIRVWTLGEKGGELRSSLIAHEDAILRLAWSPDGKYLVSASADRSIKIFLAADLSEVRTIPNQQEWISGLAISGDSKRIAVARIDGSFDFYPL